MRDVLAEPRLRNRYGHLSAQYLFRIDGAEGTVEAVGSAGFGREIDRKGSPPQTARQAQLGVDDHVVERTIAPSQIHLETAPCAQASDRACRPGLWQGGEEIDQRRGSAVRDVLVTLEQHFSDACGCAKITVNLQWSTEIEEIREGTLGEQIRELLIGEFAVTDARPERDAPRIAPASAAAATPIGPSLRQTF